MRDVMAEGGVISKWRIFQRIYRWKSHFEKGYTKRWTNELFKIVDVIDTVPWTYKVYDLEGEEILGSFYSQELQKTKLSR